MPTKVEQWELTEAERRFLTSKCTRLWSLHVSTVYHRPELWSLRKKGLVALEDQSRPWRNKPSYFVVLTEEGQLVFNEINGLAAGRTNE